MPQLDLFMKPIVLIYLRKLEPSQSFKVAGVTFQLLYGKFGAITARLRYAKRPKGQKKRATRLYKALKKLGWNCCGFCGKTPHSKSVALLSYLWKTKIPCCSCYHKVTKKMLKR